MHRLSDWRVRALLASLSFLPGTTAIGATSVNLYDWMGLAPIVVAGRVVVDDQKHVEMQVLRTFRGNPENNSTIRIDVKKANRDRDFGMPALRLEKGKAYLALLEPAAIRDRRRASHYDVVRGVLGVREVPVEGAPAFLDAAERLAQVQGLKEDSQAWHAFGQMLEDTNALLVETALGMFLKFRRGAPSLLPALHPLLDHPRPDLRAAAAALIGQILERRSGPTRPEQADLVSDLIRRARRDPSIEVRVAATVSLGCVQDRAPLEVLHEIAREDPEQAVRYAAERVLYERRSQDGSSKPSN